MNIARLSRSILGVFGHVKVYSRIYSWKHHFSQAQQSGQTDTQCETASFKIPVHTSCRYISVHIKDEVLGKIDLCTVSAHSYLILYTIPLRICLNKRSSQSYKLIAFILRVSCRPVLGGETPPPQILQLPPKR